MKMLLGRGQWRMPSLPRSPGGQGYFMFLSLIQTWRDPYWWNFQVAYRSVRQQIMKTSNSRNLNHAMWRVNAVVVKGCNITAATANACDGQTLRLCMPDLLWSCAALLCVSLLRQCSLPSPAKSRLKVLYVRNMLVMGRKKVKDDGLLQQLLWATHTRRWSSPGQIKSDLLEKEAFFFLLPLTSQGLFFSELLANNLLECAECCPPYFLHNCKLMLEVEKGCCWKELCSPNSCMRQDNFEIGSGCSEPCAIEL